jgi:hypothetical protein
MLRIGDRVSCVVDLRRDFSVLSPLAEISAHKKLAVMEWDGST